MNPWNIVKYAESHFDGVAALWREAFPNPQPWNAPEVTIPAKLAIQSDLFLLAIDREQVIGSVLAGYDGHRGWLYAVAVLKAHQRRGIGSALVREAERRLLEELMRSHSSLSPKEICAAVLDYSTRRDQRFRDLGEGDMVDDKTVFVIKRSGS